MSASIVDFQAPFDPTAFTTISGAQLLELIAAAQPYSDKGMIVVTSDNTGVPIPPDALTYTKFERYFWLRLSPLTTSFAVYAWNPLVQTNIGYSNGSGLFITSNWNPITNANIAAGSIQGFMIAAATITADKIISVDISQITGFSPGNYVASVSIPNAAGNIGGSYSAGLTILNAAITAAMMGNNSVATASIINAAVTLAKLDATAGADKQILTNSTGTAVTWATPPLIYSTTGIPVAANGGKLLAVNAGATDYTLVSPTATSVGRLVQCIIKGAPTPDSTATVIPYDATIPQITEGKEYVTVTITPTSATNILKITFGCMLGNNTDGDRSTVALFQDATGNALQAVAIETPDGTGDVGYAAISYYMLAGATAATTFRIRFGPSANTGYINQSSAAALFGAAANSYLMVEEIVGTLS